MHTSWGEFFFPSFQKMKHKIRYCQASRQVQRELLLERLTSMRQVCIGCVLNRSHYLGQSIQKSKAGAGCTAVLLPQDTTTRIWDMRMTNRSVHTLLGNMAAIRSLRYSSDGKYLAAAEAADFVHLYDVDAGYSVYGYSSHSNRACTGWL